MTGGGGLGPEFEGFRDVARFQGAVTGDKVHRRAHAVADALERLGRVCLVHALEAGVDLRGFVAQARGLGIHGFLHGLEAGAKLRGLLRVLPERAG